MRLQHKIFLLSVVPLLVSLGLIAWAVQWEQSSLADARRLQLRTAYMSLKQDELRHYVALAMSTISPIYNLGQDDESAKQQVMQRLANLDYGPDGYFFLYTLDGVNLMHPREPDLVGRNLSDIHDSRGEPTIRMLLERARTGGGFVVYRWMKPSTHRETPKLGYVTVLERWGWMVGTGMYLDDVDKAMQDLDDELESNIHDTLLWIACAGVIGVALIFGCTQLLRSTERQHSDAKLRLLALKLVDSQEVERSRLSRELHDSTGQTLVVIKLLIESTLERVDQAQAAVRAPLEKAVARVQEVLLDVRNMSHRLRPVMLDTLGLPAALENLGVETFGQFGVEFAMEVSGTPDELPDEVKTMLFRITQEAMTNIQKHAACRYVSLRLDFAPQALELSIQDDGRGFDVEAMAANPRRGIGLQNMRERTEALGGQFSITSQPGWTSVKVTLSRDAIERLGHRTL